MIKLVPSNGNPIHIRNQMTATASLKSDELVPDYQVTGKKMTKLLKREYKEDFETSISDRFLNSNLNNVAIQNGSEHESFTNKLSKRIVKDSIDKQPELLINSGSDIFFKFAIETYHAFENIKYITISLTIMIVHDGDDEDDPSVFMDKLYKIPNLNSLCMYIMRRDGIIESLGMYMGNGDNWYSVMDMIEDVCILYNDDTSERMSFDYFKNKFNINFNTNR